MALDKAQLSLFRNYLYEICICALAACVVFLFHMVFRIVSEKETYLLNDNRELIKTVKDNTEVIKQNNAILMSIQNYHQGFKPQKIEQ